MEGIGEGEVVKVLYCAGMGWDWVACLIYDENFVCIFLNNLMMNWMKLRLAERS